MFLSTFLNNALAPAIYTLSLHDALPIFREVNGVDGRVLSSEVFKAGPDNRAVPAAPISCLEELVAAGYRPQMVPQRSEEHTSELQSLTNLVCRLLLEKKKKNIKTNNKCT